MIEVASFNGASLRKTARRLNLLTDASQRYVKGALDEAKSVEVIDRVTTLLLELADAKEVYETVSTGLNIKKHVVSLRENRVNELLGTNISVDENKDIFNRLKFEYTQSGNKVMYIFRDIVMILH